MFLETNGSTENSSDEEVDKEDYDISRMVLTSKLHELPPLILSEYFSAKVTVRSKMTILEDIQKWLTEEDKTIFRSYPQLGPLIDLPIGGEFFSALAHNLLLRKTVYQKDHEVLFLIEGKPLRFSLNESVLISGLYTGDRPSKDEIKAQEEKNELKNKYWPTKKSVLLADVAKKLKEFSVTKIRTKDRVKLAFQYMVARFLTSSDSKKAMPKLCEMMAKKLALNEKNKNGPRWLRWQNVQNPIGTSFDPCLEAMRSADFTVRPTLNFSSKERQREYYLQMERREDCSDDVIDGLMKLLEGDVILCSAADSDERSDELRSSHISRDPATILRSFPASSAHEQMIGAFTPMVWQRQHPMPTSPTSLDPATALRFLTPVGPQIHGAMPTTSTPNLESLMHYIDRRIGEHETYMKSMLANHEVAIVQKLEANNKAIMKKIESAMAMNKEACSGGVNVEFERQLSRGVETRYSGGDNFECQ
ncbi:hypothetical protein TIFTF001_020493 [Ficus carica]|uniref:DUF1985 domain-containing protein n=1 Tax=Ficus carica TaxID=3494 RepID=A0AA88DB48_FICCA|nr:hypothetical protein TIFTF001_020493 [Ficus carica]